MAASGKPPRTMRLSQAATASSRLCGVHRGILSRSHDSAQRRIGELQEELQVDQFLIKEYQVLLEEKEQKISVLQTQVSLMKQWIKNGLLVSEEVELQKKAIQADYEKRLQAMKQEVENFRTRILELESSPAHSDQNRLEELTAQLELEKNKHNQEITLLLEKHEEELENVKQEQKKHWRKKLDALILEKQSEIEKLLRQNEEEADKVLKEKESVFIAQIEEMNEKTLEKLDLKQTELEALSSQLSDGLKIRQDLEHQLSMLRDDADRARQEFESKLEEERRQHQEDVVLILEKQTEMEKIIKQNEEEADKVKESVFLAQIEEMTESLEKLDLKQTELKTLSSRLSDGLKIRQDLEHQLSMIKEEVTQLKVQAMKCSTEQLSERKKKNQQIIAAIKKKLTVEMKERELIYKQQMEEKLSDLKLKLKEKENKIILLEEKHLSLQGSLDSEMIQKTVNQKTISSYDEKIHQELAEKIHIIQTFVAKSRLVAELQQELGKMEEMKKRIKCELKHNSALKQLLNEFNIQLAQKDRELELARKVTSSKAQEVEGELIKSHHAEITQLNKKILEKDNDLQRTVKKYEEILERLKEIEYLRKAIFEYMMGHETKMMAKVITTVLKFSADQVQKILEQEEARSKFWWLF